MQPKYISTRSAERKTNETAKKTRGNAANNSNSVVFFAQESFEGCLSETRLLDLSVVFPVPPPLTWTYGIPLFIALYSRETEGDNRPARILARARETGTVYAQYGGKRIEMDKCATEGTREGQEESVSAEERRARR